MTAIKKIFSNGLAWLWVAIIVIAIDRFTKIWVMNHLIFQEPLKVLPFFDLTLAYNTGAAFSFLHTASGWQNWFLGGLALVVSIIVIYWLKKSPVRAYWMNIAFCLVLGGALGNAWDRFLYGYVIDFLSFHVNDWHFAIFNMADSAICVGAFMIICYWIKYGKD